MGKFKLVRDGCEIEVDFVDGETFAVRAQKFALAAGRAIGNVDSGLVCLATLWASDEQGRFTTDDALKLIQLPDGVAADWTMARRAYIAEALSSGLKWRARESYDPALLFGVS
jgi:hypothetical protein